MRVWLCNQDLFGKRERDIKVRLHSKFCDLSSKVVREDEVHTHTTVKSITELSNIYSTGINITIPECNQEATLNPQELTSALLI